jgi:hypothetical protein
MPKYLVAIRTNDQHKTAVDQFEVEAPNEMQAGHDARMMAAEAHGGKGKDYVAEARKL